MQNKVERNPLRIIDSRNKAAKRLLREHRLLLITFAASVKPTLRLEGGLDNLEIAYSVDKNIVRDLIFTRTVFEFVSDNIGAQ